MKARIGPSGKALSAKTKEVIIFSNLYDTWADASLHLLLLKSFIILVMNEE